MTGIDVSGCGLRRMVFLRPTIVEGRCSSGEGETEEEGELRTEMMCDLWVEDPRAILREGWMRGGMRKDI